MHVTVIAKAPVPGRVKTRLCPPCTHEQAAELAATALLETLRVVDASLGSLPVRRVLLLDGERPSWVPPVFEVVAQSAGSLGDRLAAGFELLGPGLMIGMDTPGAASRVGAAIGSLVAGFDVLGAALDGGYWGIGLTRADPPVFDGVEMSTERTGRDQRRRLAELGRTVVELPPARDIDDFDDVRALAASRSEGSTARAARALVAAIDAAAHERRTAVVGSR